MEIQRVVNGLCCTTMPREQNKAFKNEHQAHRNEEDRSEAGLGCHRARKLRHVVLLFWMFSGDGDCVPFRTARRPFIHTAVEFFPNVYRLAVK